MKSLQEFEQFVDTELATDLAAVNKGRKKSFQMLVIGSLISIAFVGFMIYNAVAEDGLLRGGDAVMTIVILFVAFYIISFGVYMVMKRRAKASGATPDTSQSYGFAFDFKDKVIRRMVEFIDPSFKYQINNHIKLQEILQSGIVHSNNKYQLSGSDLIQGTEDGVPFRFSDVHLCREKTFVSKNENPLETVLAGSFFIADLNKTFKSPVYVYAKKTLGVFTEMDSLQYTGEKIRLEDPEFDKLFSVHGEDQLEARYILTPTMMERLKKLRAKMGSNVYISFIDNRIYIANNNGKDRFEVGFFTSVDKRENVVQYYNDLSEQLSIIDELKLNVSIWKA